MLGRVCPGRLWAVRWYWVVTRYKTLPSSISHACPVLCFFSDTCIRRVRTSCTYPTFHTHSPSPQHSGTVHITPLHSRSLPYRMWHQWLYLSLVHLGSHCSSQHSRVSLCDSSLSPPPKKKTTAGLQLSRMSHGIGVSLVTYLYHCLCGLDTQLCNLCPGCLETMFTSLLQHSPPGQPTNPLPPALHSTPPAGATTGTSGDVASLTSSWRPLPSPTGTFDTYASIRFDHPGTQSRYIEPHIFI